MKVRVFIQRLRETRVLDLDEDSRAEDLLKTLRISSSEVVPAITLMVRHRRSL
jgi:hypothetical protein